MRIWRIPAMAIMALALSACDNHGLRSHGGPLVTFTLSGAVAEMTPNGPSPVAGVRIEETSTHQNTTTDDAGFYILSGLYTSKSTFAVSKPGYVTDETALTISADTELNPQLHRAVTWNSSSGGSIPLPGRQAKRAMTFHHPATAVSAR